MCTTTARALTTAPVGWLCHRQSRQGVVYSEYPSLRPADLQQGDLAPNYDFRGFYATVVEKWLGLDPVPIVGGNFEQLDFI